MDVWYPLRASRPQLDQLRWSLRTLQNLPVVGRVFLAGFQPDWVRDVEYLPTLQDRGKFHNIGANLKALLDSDVSDPFLAMNDDQFILEPWAPVISARAMSLDEFCAKMGTVGSRDHDDYVRGMRSQQAILKGWGMDTSQPNPDSHWPMPVDKARLKSIVARVEAEHPDHELGHFKALYAYGLPMEAPGDCKVVHWSHHRDHPVISTSRNSFLGAVGRMIRDRYPDPSPWEVP
jgi:hypothetical protein